MLNLNISVSETLKQVYASSALRCYMGAEKGVKPALLTSDRRPALHLLVRDAFSFVIVDMLPNVASMATAIDDNDEILSVNLDIDANKGEGFEITHLVTSAIAFYTLYLVYIGADIAMAKEFGALAEKSVERIRCMVREAKLVNPGCVTPHDF